MALFWDMLETYWAPRQVFARRKTEAEPRAFAYLVGASAMTFIAGLPELSLPRQQNAEIPFEALFWGRFFAIVFILPLVYYALSGLCILVMRAFGYSGAGLPVRLALFWSFFAIGPVMIAYGTLVGAFGRGVWINLLGFISVFWFIWICAIMLKENMRP